MDWGNIEKYREEYGLPDATFETIQKYIFDFSVITEKVSDTIIGELLERNWEEQALVYLCKDIE